MRDSILEKITLFDKIRNYYIIIFAFAFLTYSQTLFFNYVYLDDNGIILEHYEQFNSLNKIDDAFTTNYLLGHYYRPLITISLLIDAQIGGQAPFFYHLTNVILHSIASCLVFLLLLKLKIKKKYALFASLFFAASPVLTNAVSWILGRNDIIMAIFAMTSFIFFIKFLENGKWANLLIYITTLFLGVLSKENSLMIPVISLGYYLLVNKNLKFNLKNILLFLSWIGIFVFYFAVKWLILSSTGKNILGILPFLNNIFILPESFIKLFWPINLKVLPNYNPILTLAGSILLLTFIALPIFINSINKKKYLFGLLWFIVFLSPSMLVRPIAPDGGFNYLDCRIYLPAIGILIMLSELLSILNKKVAITKITLGLILVLLFSLNQIESKDYKNAENFWNSAIKDYPDRALFYRGLAYYYNTQKKFNKAVKIEEKAIKVNPMIPSYYHEASIYYTNLNEYQKAINKLKKVIHIETDRKESYVNIMYLSAKLDLIDTVNVYMHNFIKDIKDKQIINKALLNIAANFKSENNLRMAIFFTRKTIEIEPKNAVALNDLGVYEYLAGNKNLAKKYFKEAIDIDPANQSYKNNLMHITGEKI